MKTGYIHFLLDDQMMSLNDVDPNITVLQYLREFLLETGTKEGCGSGDCGACTVVVATLLDGSPDRLHYQAINACITLLGSLHGKQLITAEHLKQSDKLHPVQQSLVDNHASQCGFCTPGFVMSSFALHKNNSSPNREEVIEALAGNLCRCTGYRSIIDATMQSSQSDEPDSFVKQYKTTIKKLTEINQQTSAQLETDNKVYYAPKNIAELSKYLNENPKSTLLAGGTDLALSITQDLLDYKQLVYVGDVAELGKIEDTDENITVGSAVTYSQFLPIIDQYYPEFGQMIARIGSTQIRNRGTLGGNIGNASPIGDMPPVLIALEADVILQRSDKQRKVAVEDYFTGYKQTLLLESEFIKDIIINKLQQGEELKVYKVSKRFDDDISTVLAAVKIKIENKKVMSIRIAFGGMAEIPKRATQCELALLDKRFNQENFTLAQQALTKDFQPMSDVRASADYRMKVAQNIIQKCYLELKNKDCITRVANYA
jgi:xanthine dehydrogenase small subunit